MTLPMPIRLLRRSLLRRLRNRVRPLCLAGTPGWGPLRFFKQRVLLKFSGEKVRGITQHGLLLSGGSSFGEDQRDFASLPVEDLHQLDQLDLAQCLQPVRKEPL